MANWKFPRPGMVRPTLVVDTGTFFKQVADTHWTRIKDVAGADRVRRVSIDADQTANTPHRPEPLPTAEAEPDAGDDGHVAIQQPSAEYVKSIKDGDRGGTYDAVEMGVIESLTGAETAGVGGTRAGGRAIALLNADRIRNCVRIAMLALAGEPGQGYDGDDRPVTAIFGSGTAGGMDGASDPVREIVREEAARLHIAVRAHRIVVVPGMRPIPDDEGGRANAATGIREMAALNSGRYETFRYDGNGTPPRREPRTPEPAFLVSDTANSPGQFTHVETKNLVSQVARFLELVTTTPLGDQLQGQLVDFEQHAKSATPQGETRTARSFGLSEITLNREQIGLYATARLSRAALAQLRGRTPSRSPEKDVKVIVGQHQLRQGAGYRDLSDCLRQILPDGKKGDDLATRFRGLLRQNLGALHGTELLRNGPARFDATKQQVLNDAQSRMQAAGRGLVDKTFTDQGLVRRVMASVERRIAAALASPNEGVEFAKEFVEALIAFVENAGPLAADERRKHVEQLTAAEAGMKDLLEKGAPEIEKMNAVSRFVNSDRINQFADEFDRTAARIGTDKIDDLAREEAGLVLERLASALDVVKAAVIDLRDAVEAASTEFSSTEASVRGWDGVLVTSKGVSLNADIDEIYGRLICTGNAAGTGLAAAEAAAGAEILALVRKDGLLKLARQEKALAGAVDRVVAARLRPLVEGLHVQDELLRQYPTAAALRAFLRARDREAFEAVPLNGLADQDDPDHFLKYVCSGSHRIAEILGPLNAAARPRGKTNPPYKHVATDDPERIVLVQIRLSFPATRHAFYPEWRRHLEDRLHSAPGRAHSEVQGRYLPEPGVAGTATDAALSLLKAHLIGAVHLPPHGAGTPVYRDVNGANVPIDTNLSALREYGARVEIATRFFNAWREKGPGPLRAALQDVAAAQQPGTSPNGAVASHVAPLVAVSVIEQVESELAFYENSVPKSSTWWGRQP